MDELDCRYMQRALELAALGEGSVEPNPMVGAVLVRDGSIVGEGWHQRFGGPHAEVEALRVAGERARGATLYVTLEPCCHHGKTPPCAEAVLQAGISRVVVAEGDPFPLVAGGGIARLRASGVRVEVGCETTAAHRLNAPFHCLVQQGRPWVIAKWAMSLDGKIATRTGASRWISNTTSREQVHRLRARVDGILVGRGTVLADDPQLTARPPGARQATRIVLDSTGNSLERSTLLRTARETPVLVVATDQMTAVTRSTLDAGGCEILIMPEVPWTERIRLLLQELGRRRLTNLLVEGGGRTLGGFFDADLVDEVHVYVGPRVLGGDAAPSPLGGLGVEDLDRASRFADVTWEMLDGDLHFRGRCSRS